jgi:hypothetical protein
MKRDTILMEILVLFYAVASQEDINVDEEDKGLPLTMGGDGSEAIAALMGRPDWFMDVSEIKALKVEKLKGEIRHRGLEPKRKKGELVKIIETYLDVAKKCLLTISL